MCGSRPCAVCRRKMRRCSAAAWNPEVATQLMVACEDDLSPTLQMWDLRNSVAPLRELNGHDKARSYPCNNIVNSTGAVLCGSMCFMVHCT